MNDLTILCITAGKAHAQPFLDHHRQLADDLQATYLSHWAPDAGTIEHVLDTYVNQCDNGYILRLDDDERVSPQLEQWLHERAYREHDHWAFPRLNLWPDENAYLASHGLWPDHQTRLSVKHKAGGRRILHQGSPHGTGRICEAPIEHHKFLVRTLAERRALLDHYENKLAAPLQFRPFTVPEDFSDLIVISRHAVAA